MGTTVRSIFARLPLAIPPPVVCLVIDDGVIDVIIIIIIRQLHQSNRWRPNGYILTEVSFVIEWKTVPANPNIQIRGKFFPGNLIPAQPINPINDEPLPMPYPSETTIDVTTTEEIDIAFGTPRYDDTVSITVQQPGMIFGTKYLNLGEIKPQET